MSAPTTARQYFDHTLTEREFQQAVVNLARATGWMIYHTWRSDKSPAGFPDLVLVRPPRLIFAELKTEKGRVTPEQVGWLEALRAVAEAPGCNRAQHIEADLWRPSMWESIERALIGGPQ